jgi:hypothetical protein
LDPSKKSRQHKTFVDDFAGDRRQAPRCEVRRNVSLRFSLSPDEEEAGTSAPRSPLMCGETRNLSETGLAISLSSNHIGSRYFNVIGCTLRLALDLPDGPVQILATPKWCKWFLEEETVKSYLLGLKIVEMTDEEWVRLVRYVRACL